MTITEIMSADELEKFHEAFASLEKLAGLLKAGVAAAFTVCAFVAGIAVWVNNTTANAEQTKKEFQQLVIERAERLKDWEKWRKDKDDIDLKLAWVVESQQKQLDRIDRKP